jgi:RHS repeat-associated protein
VTQYAYDGRDRLVAMKAGVQSSEDHATHRPILYYQYDNLDEVTSVAQYDGDGVPLTNTAPSPTLLRGYSVNSYDDLGRVYRTQQFGVDQSTGAVFSNALTTNYFYGTRGYQIAEYDPGGLVTKDQYDGAGRLVVQAETDGAGGMGWNQAGTLNNDNVLTETLTTYDNNGNPTLVTTKDRFDTDAGTGPLGNVQTTPYVRAYYTAYYYDAADRLTATVDVGTNGGTIYTPPASPPASSATVHTTSYVYGLNGRLQELTDPRGVNSYTSYDMLGQVTQTIDAYTGGSPTASTNQTTNYTYDGNGDVATITAVMPTGTPSQTTKYVYGVTIAGGSGVNSNDLLATTEYPDPTTGNPSTSSSNEENYQYNALGDQTLFTDPNGTTHSYGYDVLGRPISDSVTTLGSGVDGTVRELTTAYDTGGRPYLFTSYSSPTGGTVVNQVENLYNELGQLTNQYQEHRGAVNASTTADVQYAYTDLANGANNSRPTSMTYPNGRVLDYVYNSGIDNSISRLSALADDNSGSPGTILEAETYLGLDTIVQRAHPESGVNLTYIQYSGDTKYNADGGDKYTGLDRFGRVIDQYWVNSNTGATADRYQYTYDRVDDVLVKNNLVDTALGELYRSNAATGGDSNTAYDPLQRMTTFQRGTLSSSGLNGSQLDTISSPSRTQSWSLDALGNQSSVTTNGSATTRTFNAQNQTTSVSSGTAPTYDHNGNTITDNGQTFVYDAWNRLVAVKSGSSTVASYLYDGQGWRIRETYGSSTNDLYYDSDWQVIEAQVNGTGTSNIASQYVWSPADINALVLRDSYSNGVRTTRLYALQDANDNVTSLVTTSGNVGERYMYDPYGNVSVMDQNWGSRSASVYGWIYLFQGDRLDGTTGWYGSRERDYTPAEGRWAERDPLGLNAGDRNIYEYLKSSPANGTDPLGEGWWGGNQDKNDPRCVALLQKIENIKKEIAKRTGELDEDALKLPSTCPGDDKKPSLSRKGHVKLLNLMKKYLAQAEAEYKWNCDCNY